MSATDLGNAIDKRVVLTGAGFSRNWGGYLASEMWGAILGHPAVEANGRLRQALLDQTDFEAALFEVRTRRDHFKQQDRIAQVFERGRHRGHGADSGDVDRLRDIFLTRGDPS